MMRILLVICITCIVTACASGPYPVTSSYFNIPAGSQIELKQPLTIAPNRARVYLQYGKVVSEREKDRYQPHCWFLSWKVLETPQPINVGTFTVLRSQKDEEIVRKDSNIKLASNSPRVGVGVGVTVGGSMDPLGGSAPLAVVYTTQIHIHSDRQPDIRMLECSHWDDPSSGEHLTVEQMQNALGDIATIIIKP